MPDITEILSLLFKNPTQSEECKKLRALWQKLCDCNFLYQEGPYPAGHGKQHIENILLNLSYFIDSYGDSANFNDSARGSVLAAGMIHDINMTPMRSVGATGPKAEKTRLEHSDEKLMSTIGIPILTAAGFSQTQSELIVEIASAHASDDRFSADQKLKYLAKREKSTGIPHLVSSAVLVQIADFFDIGTQRLTGDATAQQWDASQMPHLKKHATVRITINKENKLINLYLSKDNEIKYGTQVMKISPMERYKIIYMVCEEAQAALDRLNNEFNYTGIGWTLNNEKTIFGKILPMGEGMNIFEKELKLAYNAWQTETPNIPFPVDFMGHSLYGRFVDDEEGLNEQIKSHLRKSGIKLRILLLDPGVENQQMCEVFDAQLSTDEEKGRSILPLYDYRGEIAERNADGHKIKEKGDILNTLDALKEWIKEVKADSSMEVRTTTRLMYMSIGRLGNTIIVTPYRRKGLFKDSIALVFKKEKTPLFDAYNEVFEDVWESRFETTMKLFKYPNQNTRNPVMFFLPEQQTRMEIANLLPFNYERFLLGNYLERIKAIFDNVRSGENKFIPPFEMEIQPSEECTLHCSHCIGKYLSQRHGEPSELNSDLSSLLQYEVDGWKIERFRISGLLGDPLSENVKGKTIDFINKAKDAGRKVIIITNGIFIIDKSVLGGLLQADCIHVSLDAASPKTFQSLKGVDCFDKIIANIDVLCSEIKQSHHSSTIVGIGFVVTQGNAHEVLEAIKLAIGLRADFIRFKPDIRGTHAISWRTWKKAEADIKNKKKEEKHLDIIMTEAGWSNYRVPVVNRCWAQFLYSTIGADSNLYPCDHLTANGIETALGSIGTFKDVWENATITGSVGRRRRECILCPPFGWRLNRLIEQLYVLYEGHSWEAVRAWITEALNSAPKEHG